MNATEFGGAGDGGFQGAGHEISCQRASSIFHLVELSRWWTGMQGS